MCLVKTFVIVILLLCEFVKHKCRSPNKITSRDQAGHIQSCLLPKNAGTLSFNYDKLSRRTKTLHDKFQEEAQSFDPVGNLLELQTGNDHRSFRYDFLSQLIEEKGPTSHTYSYDSLYNRLSQDDQKYTVNSLHSVLTDSKRQFTYDARGNRTTQDSISYKYDALDRLIAVGTTTYTYDAFNRRLTKSDGTKYIYALDNEIGAVNSEGKITELRLLGEGLGAEIGAAVAIELDDTLYIPLHDRQGNVTTLLDAQGQVADSYRYDAFGNEVNPSHKTKNPWRFSSKRVDEETGFIYFGRRYYDPTLGKWLTQDPLGLKAGPNLYAYVNNNSMLHIDLYGLMILRSNAPFELKHHGGNVHHQSFKAHYESQGFSFQYGKTDSQGFSRVIAISYGNRKIPGLSFVCVNGLNMSFSRSLEMVKYLSNEHTGAQVDLVFDQATTLYKDTAIAGLERELLMQSQAEHNFKERCEQIWIEQGHEEYIVGEPISLIGQAKIQPIQVLKSLSSILSASPIELQVA